LPDAGLAVRWPNDLVDRDGRKVAGLLVETALERAELAEVVIGIGINVNWDPAEMPADFGAGATSLRALVGTVDRVDLLRRVLEALDSEMSALGRGDPPLERLRAHSWLDGRQVEVDTGDGRVIGRAVGIGDDGSLLLDAGVGRLALSVGEVARVVESAATTVRE
jgi:BirA family biotin operon repressor/biotin-[acetyl-CoA-carboxylase] ligase